MARTQTSRTAGSRSGTRPMIRASRTDSFEIITAPTVHPLARVTGLVIRLRAELTAVLLVVAVWLLLTAWFPVAGGLAVLAITVAAVLAVPPLRTFVAQRGAAVMTRHRLRQVLVERRCVNFSRNVPLFLWSHPNQVGETVWLLLRAGISPSDVADQSEWIASGCFARDARVIPTRRMSALVRVEVIRRDPLTRELIASELAGWTATTGQPVPRGARVVPPRPANQHWSDTASASSTAPGPVVVPAPRPTLDESDDVPNVQPDPPQDAPAPAPAPEAAEDGPQDAASEPAMASRGGDWSDYV